MTLQTIPGGLWLPGYPFIGEQAPNIAGFGLDALDEQFGCVVQAPKAGEIAKILYRVGGVSGGTWVLDCRLEDVGVDGLPDGSLVDTNSNGDQTVLVTDDDTWFATAFTASATVTQGQWIAAVLKVTTFPGSGDIDIERFADNAPVRTRYCVQDTTGSWAKSSDIIKPVFGFEYDDGSYEFISGVTPFVPTSVVFNNTDTPDHIGVRFQVPFPTRVTGAWVQMDPDGDFNVVLTGSDGDASSPAATATVDKDFTDGNIPGVVLVRFNAAVTLVKDTNYWLAVVPTSATDLTLYFFDVNAAAVMDAFEGGQNWQYATGKDPTSTGDWSMTATRRAFIGLLCDQFDDGTGGAGVSSILGGGNVEGGFA